MAENEVYAESMVEGRPDLTEVINLIGNENKWSDEEKHEKRAEYNTLFAKMTELIAEHGDLHIHGFGSFRLRKLEPKNGIDPNGNEYSVGERLKADFNAFNHFRETVEKIRGVKCLH